MSSFDDEEFKQLQLKVKFHVIPKTRLKKFNQLFAGYKTGLVKSEPGKFVMTTLYAKHAEILYRMEPRADDIWLLTFPKCGELNLNLRESTFIHYIPQIWQVQRGHLSFCGC